MDWHSAIQEKKGFGELEVLEQWSVGVLEINWTL